MKDFAQNLEFYIEQYDLEKALFELGKEIKRRGWLSKDEFLTICLWKSRRPKNLYMQNSNKTIKQISEACFKEINEIKKIQLLIELRGVGIPTASAILSIVDPENYPIIDERCIQSLNDLSYIKWTTINENRWIEYLNIIRKISKQKNKSAREIEKGLFAYNRVKLDKEYKNLYNLESLKKRNTSD